MVNIGEESRESGQGVYDITESEVKGFMISRRVDVWKFLEGSRLEFGSN